MHIFTIAVRRVALPSLILLLASMQLRAQQQDSVSAPVQDVLPKAKVGGLKISGEIKDATNKPLDGINIRVEGYSAAITNEKGQFTISVPHRNSVLIISGPGFQAKEVPLKGKGNVSAVLYDDSFSSIYDVASLPFSKQSFNHVTGAVKSVNVEDSWQRSNESADTYLQGKITGLNSIRRSGTPGIGASLFLRGFNSLYTNNQPLIIVDGIIYDNTNYGLSLIGGHVDNPIANIDLKDIDNFTVIKDATASSYGSRAGNGVVLITTARAKEQATKIDFSAYGGVNTTPASIPLLDDVQYRTYLSDAQYSYYRSLGLNELNAQKLTSNSVYMDSENPNYYKYTANTNWQKKVMDLSQNQNYYLKITGGDNIATYGLAVGYLNSQGIVKNTGLQRYQTRFNADLNLSTKLKGNANLSYVSNSHSLRDQGIAYKTNPVYLALTKAPFMYSNQVALQEDGRITQSPNLEDVDVFNRSNPSSVIDDMIGTNKNYRFMGSVGFDYKFNKHFNLSVLGGVTFSKVRETSFKPNVGIVADTLIQQVAVRSAGTNVERLYSVFTDTRLSYNRAFNYSHHLSANVGLRFNDNQMETDYGFGYNASTDDYVSVTNGLAALRDVGGENGDWRWLNMYGGVDYDYLKRYFLSFNMAVDGSSRFGRDVSQGISIGGARFALMPSLGAAWLISSEDFIDDKGFINVLKLRTSFGIVGNEDIGNYSAKQLYVSQNFFSTQGLVRGNVPNTSLQWENVTKLNLGVDASMLKERLNVSFDLFRNKTTKMLLLEPVSSVTGFSYGYTNNGEMKSSGIELGVSGRLLNRAVKWDIGVNLSNYKTEILSIPGDRLLNTFGGATILTKEGRDANLFYGYRTNGVYASTDQVTASGIQNRKSDGSVTQFQAGDVIFNDMNRDGYIDEDDREVIGNPNPDITGMFSNNVSWKRFSFDATFSFSLGNDIYNSVRRELESMDGAENQTRYVMNRWRAEGQVTNVPRAAIGDPNGNSRFSDRWIEDGSYLRLRSLSIAYNVPVTRKALKAVKVYLTGNNVFTLSKYLGYDPEFSATGSVFTQGIDTGLEPQYRTIQLGVRIGL